MANDRITDTVVAIVSIIIGIIMVVTCAIPAIANAAGSEETITINNPDEHGIVLGLKTSDFNYDLEFVDNSDDTFTIGENTYDFAPMILVATDDFVIFIGDNNKTTVLGNNDDEIEMGIVTSFNLSIDQNMGASVIMETGGDSQFFAFPMPTTYLYYPDENGEYSSWTEGNLNKSDASPVISVGSFAGVGCYYNNLSTPPLIQNYPGLLSADANFTPTMINEVKFISPTAEYITPITDSLVIHPIDIQEGSESSVMSLGAVPTPEYTDGDWGYNIIHGGADNGKAIIVSYSGAGGGAITIPATVGGLSVVQVGKGGSNETVFNTSITATDLIISSGITTINANAFDGCSGFTGTLTLPNTVTTIRQNAFHGCSGFTGTLTLPSGLTTLYSGAFSGCTGLTGTLTLPSSLTTIHGGNNDNYGTFSNCTGLSSISFSNNLTTISDYVFTGCTGLTGTLTLPTNLTSLGRACFKGCTGITSIVFPNTTTTLSQDVFYGCTGLTCTLTLPTNLTTLGKGAFSGCTGLTGDLIIPEGITVLEATTFSGCTGLTGTLTLPSGLTKIKDGSNGYGTFRNCGFTGNLILPETLTYIGNGAFNLCSGFTGDLIIPDSVTTIAEWAFNGCSGFTGTLTLPSETSLIDDYAFSSCGFTGSLIIPEGVTTIESNAFYYNSGLTSVVLPSSLTSVHNSSFSYCTGIKNVLNLSDLEVTTTSYGLNADTVQDHIDSSSYLAPLKIEDTISTTNQYTAILNILPIILVASLIMMAVGWFVYKRD